MRKQMTNEQIDDMSIQAGLACDGTSFDDAVQLFARMIENAVKDEMRPILKDMQDLLNQK